MCSLDIVHTMKSYNKPINPNTNHSVLPTNGFRTLAVAFSEFGVVIKFPLSDI